MKKSIIPLTCSWLLAACGTQKVNCEDTKHFYLVAPTEITAVNGDSAVEIRKFKNEGAFNAVLKDTLMTLDISTGDKVARISDVFPDFLTSDFEVVFVPSQTQYSITNIRTSPKTKRIANRDRGNSTYGICYNEFSATINGSIYTSSTSYAAYIKIKQ